MFAVLISMLATHGAGRETIGTDAWIPVLPSYQEPTVEWAPGEKLPVARVNFPNWDPERPTEHIQIVAAGEVSDADRVMLLLSRGWRVLV
jgi:hypothetical protein